MASSVMHVNIRYELRNLKAAQSLLRAYQAVSEIASEKPWNEDAKEVRRDLKRAIRGLVPRQAKRRET